MIIIIETYGKQLSVYPYSNKKQAFKRFMDIADENGYIHTTKEVTIDGAVNTITEHFADLEGSENYRLEWREFKEFIDHKEY